MNKPSITITTPELGTRRTLEAIKENVEIITGRRGGKVKPLPDNATLPEIVAKINELLDRLQ